MPWIPAVIHGEGTNTMPTRSFRSLLGMTMAAAMVGVVLFTVAGFAQTPVAIAHGCTPEYWKNHTENWGLTLYYSPTQTVGSIYGTAFSPSLSSLTLLHAL